MSTKISELHAAARRWAEAGIPVFACAPGTKVPFEGTAGFHDATTDLATIDRIWGEHPDANIAFSPADMGWCVVDPDGDEGRANWSRLVEENGGQVETWTVATPRGGLHEYYIGELPPSQSKLAAHVDTRGRGSYALIPPSRIDGWEQPYRVINDVELAEVPGWVLPAILAFKKEHAKAAVTELDLPQNVERVRLLIARYLAAGDVAREGEMGDLRTYKLACEVSNLGVSPDVAFDLILPWNDACEPPWDEPELRTKIENAFAYAQNEGGAWGVSSPQEAFGSVLDKLIAESTPAREERSPFHPYTVAEQSAFAEPTWTAPDILPDDSIVCMYGQPATFKSFLALDLLLSMSSGVEGWGLAPDLQRPTVFAAGEGPRSIGRLRRPAWEVARGVAGDYPFHLVAAVPCAALPETVEDFIAEVKPVNPKVVVIDTLARFMLGLNENDAKDASLAIAALERIKKALRCTVLVIHHAGKGDTGARGSSAILGGFDTMVEVVRPQKGVKAVEVWVRKQKDADERPRPWTFEMKELGPSIVPFPTSYAEHQALVQSENAYNAKRIGAALAKLNARGVENGVTTEVLATEMTPVDPAATAEGQQHAVMVVVKQLRNLAKGALEPYCEGVGRDLKWMLP